MASQSFLDLILELLGPVGPVHCKRMFGGAGLFYQGLMFALVADDVLYLKVDPELEQAYHERGLQRFSFARGAKTLSMAYCEAPAEVLETPAAMQDWAARSIKVALQQNQSRGRKAKGSRASTKKQASNAAARRSAGKRTARAGQQSPGKRKAAAKKKTGRARTARKQATSRQARSQS